MQSYSIDIVLNGLPLTVIGNWEAPEAPNLSGHPDTWTAGHNASGEILEVRQGKISLDFNKKEFEDCYLDYIIDILTKQKGLK